MKNATRINTLRRRLEEYLEAERRILRGQSYRIGTRELTRPDLSMIQQAIADLEAELDALELKGGRIARVIF